MNCSGKLLTILLLFGLSVPLTAWSEPCQMPDNGIGTADFPPLCPYDSDDETMMMIDGFPPGSGLYLDGPLTGFVDTFETPGGTLGGTIATFNALFEWQVTGFGDLAGYERYLTVPVFYCEAHTGPRNPGDPVQTFPQELMTMNGGLFGDPDFDQLNIVGGTQFGLPSPGETTLTQLPNGDFAVDSFFDITYQIEFVGAPGSILEGLSGVTTGTIRLRTDRDDWDFGDAPDPLYPTLLASDGARHWIDGQCYLGQTIDGEGNGQPSIDSQGDDNLYTDDEDGVDFFGPMTPGNDHSIEVEVNCDGFLNLWIDYNINGSWMEPVDRVFMDLPLLPGLHSLTFTVPNNANGGNTFARVRFCTYPGLEFFGPAEGGEVEDYMVNIQVENEWKMHFPQWPDLTETGVDVSVEEPLTLADDFRCTQTGPITDITIWGSWKWDEFVPGITFFELGLWSDVPDNPDDPEDYSHPGEQLWDYFFLPGQFIEEQFMMVEPGEWWYNPVTGECFYPADYWVWQYDFPVPVTEAFVQEEGTIYWLSVKAIQPEDPNGSVNIGWKTTQLHWNDDAVWRMPDSPWFELVYPGQHPLEGQSMDLSFVIDGPTPLGPTHIWMDLIDWTWTLYWNAVPGAVGYTVYGADEAYTPWPSADWTMETTTTLNSWVVPISSSKRFFRVTVHN